MFFLTSFISFFRVSAHVKSLLLNLWFFFHQFFVFHPTIGPPVSLPSSATAATARSTQPSPLRRLITLNGFINRPRLVFALVSAGAFFALTAVAYALYGFEFVYETYLYHLVRKDNRHNFSVYFYHLYLRFELPSAGATSLLAFVPQVR